jgi:hypothetical protein
MSKVLKQSLLAICLYGVLCHLAGCDFERNEEYRPKNNATKHYFPALSDWFISESLRKFEKHIALYPITQGFDSFQLRIWFPGHPRIDSSRHLIIAKKYKRDQWKLVKYDIRYPWYGGMQDTESKPTKEKVVILLHDAEINALERLLSNVKDSLSFYTEEPIRAKKFTDLYVELADRVNYVAFYTSSPVDVHLNYFDPRIRLVHQILFILRKHPELSFVRHHLNSELMSIYQDANK